MKNLNISLSTIVILVFLILISGCGILMKHSDFEKVMALTVAEPGIKISDEWNLPQEIGYPINSPEWEDSPSISFDNKILYFTRGRDRNVAIYVSKKIGENWNPPESLVEINLKSFPTGAAHTQDEKILYVASIRPGGIGESDIYICKNVHGKWKEIKK